MVRVVCVKPRMCGGGEGRICEVFALCVALLGAREQADKPLLASSVHC